MNSNFANRPYEPGKPADDCPEFIVTEADQIIAHSLGVQVIPRLVGEKKTNE